MADESSVCGVSLVELVKILPIPGQNSHQAEICHGGPH